MPKDEELLEEETELEEEQVEEETTTETKAKPKAKNHGAFADTIKAYLDGYAATDPIFNERYQNKDKSINECCDYIINQVKKTGRQGFADEEIFAFARGYYTDDVSADDTKSTHATVVVNHTVELTEEEKQKAHDKALEEYKAKELKKLEAEEKAKIEKEKKQAEKVEKKKEEAKQNGGFEQTSLFDFI